MSQFLSSSHVIDIKFLVIDVKLSKISFEKRGNRKNRKVFLLDIVRVNFLGDAHKHGIGEVGDAASATTVLLLVHAVPGKV